MVHEGATLKDCKNDPCNVEGSIYVVGFDGQILQNNIAKEKWTQEMKDHFKTHNNTVYRYCNFRCYHDFRALIPAIEDPDDDGVI